MRNLREKTVQFPKKSVPHRPLAVGPVALFASRCRTVLGIFPELISIPLLPSVTANLCGMVGTSASQILASVGRDPDYLFSVHGYFV